MPQIEISHPSRELAKLPILQEYDLRSGATSYISWQEDEDGNKINFQGVAIDSFGNKGIIDGTTIILKNGKPIND